ITSLQVAINSAKPNDVIDLTDPKYSEITTIEQSISVNKAVTIKNFPDLGGASLNVAAEGVVLSNIGNAGVNTNASLKISGSSLSSLNITSIDMGRGSAAKTRPPRVELLSSDLSSDITVALENAYLTVNDITADRIALNADNAQLTIEDNTSVINNILTDKECKVVLEDGTSDTIPCSTDKITVTGSGKLTQVNMQAAESLILTKLSPESGLITTMKEGESIDFSHLEVIGTYMASGAVTVFTAKLTYNLQSSFTKLETDFTVSIDGALAYKRENGEPVNTGYDWSSLTAGYHNAIIESDFADRSSEYANKFEIAVTDKNVEYSLVHLEVDTSKMKKTEYLSDETLDLTGLEVIGTYHADAVMTFAPDQTHPLSDTDYAVSLANGSDLTTDIAKTVTITVSANGSDLTADFEIMLHPSCYVTYNYGYKQETVRVKKNSVVAEPDTSIRNGYGFKGWYSDAGLSSLCDFSSPISDTANLYAKWTKNKPSVGAVIYKDQTTADETNDRYIFVNEAIIGSTAVGVVFDVSSDFGKMADTDTTTDKWCDVVIKYDYASNDIKKGGIQQFWNNPTGINNITTSNTDGLNNWDEIKNVVKRYDGTNTFTESDYPVLQFIKSRVSDDTNNPWYLPAKEELVTLLTNVTEVNEGLAKIGADIIPVDDRVHWSSTLAGVGGSENLSINKMTYHLSGQQVWTSSYRSGSGASAGLTTKEKKVYKINTVYSSYTATSDIGNVAIEERYSIRAIRKFSWQSSTTGDNRYTYE
ncbi:MAG: InlB B-repeat-containing protein, partial [Spirochaetales bacterium]|nr:InlB B-repeat-containing protein [Spirochaetales bacterium]